jgi:hypothetical protein
MSKLITGLDRIDRWKGAVSARESTGSSTLYVNSVDGDTIYCSSTSTTSRSSGNFQDQPLWKRRAASVPRGIRNKMSYNSARSSRTDSKEIRIQIIKPDQSTEVPPALETVESKSFYFCTTCDTSFDDGKSWREHEYETHERQFFWSCPASGCGKRIVTCSTDFEKHHEEAHGCENCSHAYGVKRPFPSKRAWGCGFDNCQETFNSWDLRCDHVATHFEDMVDDDDKESHLNQWKYSNMVRNLLRQPDVKDAYNREMTKLHGDDKVFWPRMRWQADSSSDLTRRL